jgi:hypothetical protein
MKYSLLLIFTLLSLYSCIGDSEPDQVDSVSKEQILLKIDHDLQEMRDALPLDYGNEWIHVAARREENTIIFEYEASPLYKGEYDHEGQRQFLIEFIQGEPEMLSSQMNFKMIYKFPDGKVDTVYATPEEYNIN